MDLIAELLDRTRRVATYAAFTTFATFILLAVFALPGHAAEIAGVKLPPTAQVGSQALVFNGAGVRSVAFFRVYAAALYLPEPKRTAPEILTASGPKRLSMTMLRDVTAKQLIEALNNGIRDNNPPAEVERLRPRIEQLTRIMADIGKAASGSVITLDFVPGTGTQVGLDGRTPGAIPGEDLYRAILSIWLGDDPVDAALKKGLLGQQ